MEPHVTAEELLRLKGKRYQRVLALCAIVHKGNTRNTMFGYFYVVYVKYLVCSWTCVRFEPVTNPEVTLYG